VGVRGEAPSAHLVEHPDGIVGARGVGEDEEEPTGDVRVGKEGGQEERGGERVAEGEIA
jgi:hypothetical protein